MSICFQLIISFIMSGYGNEESSNIDSQIEELEQEAHQITRALELEELNGQCLDEEIEIDIEAEDLQDLESKEACEELEKQMMLEENKILDSTINGSCLFQNLSTSLMNSLNVSLNESSIAEPIETSLLRDEINETEIELRRVINENRDEEIKLEETLNENIIAENGWQNLKSTIRQQKDELQEQEEDLIFINAEMKLLPNLNLKNETTNSIYGELVRNLDSIKTDLAEKKEKLKEYNQLFADMESECKYIESEMLVLNVYDKEDETKKLQSQANLLEAYKLFLKELESNIKDGQMCELELPQYVWSGDTKNFVFEMSKHQETIDIKLNKLNREITFFKMEWGNINNKETQLEVSVKLVQNHIEQIQQELRAIQNQIEEKKLKRSEEINIKIDPNEESKLRNENEQKPEKESKIKSVRFQINTPEKGIKGEETSNKENQDETNCVKIERKPLDRLPKQTHRVVIHRRKQNVKPFNIIKPNSDCQTTKKEN